MTGHLDGTVEFFVAGDVLQELCVAHEQVARESACIKSFGEQFKQFRICHQQLKKHTAQSVSFDESSKLIEGRVRVGRLCELSEQERPQLAESLPSPRRNVRAARPLAQSGQSLPGV